MKNVLKISLSLMVGLAGFAASAQQTNLIQTPANNLPYFSISNMVPIGGGVILANDYLAAGATQTNSYLNSTNYSGGVVFPFSFPNSAQVALGMTATGTNASSSSTVIAYIDLGTGNGDWVSGGTMTATVSGAKTVSASYNTNTLGYCFGRVNKVVGSDATYGTTFTLGYSCKKGL